MSPRLGSWVNAKLARVSLCRHANDDTFIEVDGLNNQGLVTFLCTSSICSINKSLQEALKPQTILVPLNGIAFVSKQTSPKAVSCVQCRHRQKTNSIGPV